MKQLLALIILFSIGVYAQTQGVIVTSKASIYADSLQFEVSDTLAQKDSVWIIRPNFNANYVRLFIKGNANSSVDSLGVQLGTLRYNVNGVPIDTTWGSYVAFKDSAWNTVNTLVNNTVGKDFSLYVMPAIQLIKISLLNYRAALLTRKVDVIVQTIKD